jgi:dinuclear metal center YbgI/SA1388 family protein
MPSVADIAGFLEEFAPLRLAATWDNVGLLVGDAARPVERLMTCLTVTPASAAEAVARRADLIVTHHPLPFRPLTRITATESEGRLLLELIAAGIAVYSPHTAFDSAREGINQRLAEGLGLEQIRVLVPATDSDLGEGRWGRLAQPISLAQLAERVKGFLHVGNLQAVGNLDAPITSVAVACGSAGEFIEPAKQAGCDCLVTGEVRFHGCLAAEATGIHLVLAGHFASERFGVEQLAGVLARRFTNVETWASEREKDPLHWL